MNYSTFKSRIEDELNRADLSTQIGTWINEARNEIADGSVPLASKITEGAYRFSWLYTSTAVSTSAQNNSWPSGFIEEISFFETSKEKPLVKLDPVYFDQLLYSETDGTYGLDTTGIPTNYIDRGTSYDLYPAPSSSVELYLRYYGYPTTLSANEDEYTIDTTIPMLIVYAVCLKAYLYLRDKDAVNLYKSIASEYYNSAVNRDRKKRWANRQLRMKTYGDFDISHWKGIYQTGEPQ